MNAAVWFYLVATLGGNRLVELALRFGRREHPLAARAGQSPQSVGGEGGQRIPILLAPRQLHI